MSPRALIDTASLAAELHAAASKQRALLPLLSARFPGITIDQAYAVSRQVLDLRLASGERVSGKKIGLTAEAIQQALGIDEPDYGFLTDAMEVADGAAVSIAERLSTPMIEPEIAFVLGADLPSSGVTAELVLAATKWVTASLEIVDTRFDDPRVKIADTIADNASSALYVLGREQRDPRDLDLAQIACRVLVNGDEVQRGVGAAVMGNPLNSVAWLANRLGSYGITLNAGDVVLPGSMTPFVPVKAGEMILAEMGPLGTVSVAFS